MESNLYLGANPLQSQSAQVCGRQVTLEGETFYQIANYDRLRPFFMTVVSNADHWMFISSNGGLTAGRRDADNALFPYYTDDKIRDLAEITGSKTLLQVRRQQRTSLWEPFSERGTGIYRIYRNLYKSDQGNQLIFEEINEDLGMTFRYGWFNSRQFGFVRRSWLINSGETLARVQVLDGIQNLMPSGVGSQFNLEYSTLLDAYKKSELLTPTNLGLFRLSAIPVDRPEPAEALRATVAWSVGIKRQLTLLSTQQLSCFRSGQSLRPETDVRAECGAYFLQAQTVLPRGHTADWIIVADVSQGLPDVVRLERLLSKPTRLRQLVLNDVKRGTTELQRIVAGADGMQQTAQTLVCTRHYSNVLFNIMRGGVFQNGYQLDRQDLVAFAQNANRELAEKHNAFFHRLPSDASYGNMVSLASSWGDPQLERICREYLPLTFSRRHGDPSRPWNKFSIATQNAEGTRRLDYEGNWRDIFQNWEALALSFPGYVSGMICRFLNASTADGYNPYRITRNGIDWEVVDPHDPWSHIGYWGDHQIVYLLKLLEHLDRHDPEELRSLLTRHIFSYANVPYRIKPYQDLLFNPKDTVVFDQPLEQLIRQRVASKGADGKLIWNRKGQVRLVNGTEKLLVPLLVKLSNFIPGAGIWLNTQRPEWNDANNALVGNGTSMVTLCYMRRYLTFCLSLFGDCSGKTLAVSEDVAACFDAVARILKRHHRLLAGEITDTQRMRVLDALGRAGNDYRQRIYTHRLTNRSTRINGRRLLAFFEFALDWVNHSIRSNRRTDGLYHSYNLVRFENRKALPIRRLYEMLEGQVAVLSSGHLSAEESLEVLKALRRSAMYRADQHSYLLYPDRQLPRFTEKNIIPARQLQRSVLLRKLLADGSHQLVEPDAAGGVHFNSIVKNERDIRDILDQLAETGHARLVQRESWLILEIFERLFDHKSFTGRSGTFFGYEGLGCIYWHMVSKLLLAVQETYYRGVKTGASKRVLTRLADAYYDIRAGLGDSKTPQIYGAFPMDPYSHTPGQGGARQPGLTGQVKEDILCRFGELGVVVQHGEIHFSPGLLRRCEFLAAPKTFAYFDVAGRQRQQPLKSNELAFTYCQVPIIYQLGQKCSLTIVEAGGQKLHCANLNLNALTSRALFDRTGQIARINVSLSSQALRRSD